MKLALIPPLQLLESWTSITEYQLVLPQWLRHPGYARHYQSLCAQPDKFVILDNGEAESNPFDAGALLIIAETNRVDEVVACDVLRDAESSYLRSYAFLNEAEQMDYEGRIAVVAQGKNTFEAYRLAASLIEDNNRITAVHIPRLLIRPGHEWARLDLAAKIHTHYPYIDIHLLGASNAFPKEVLVAARDYPFIRSMDTSMPFVYAWHYVSLGKTIEKPPHRDGNPEYFMTQFVPAQIELAKANAMQMLSWADGVE